MSEQMTRVTDVLELLGKVDRVTYNTGWESKSLAEDAAREITRLRTLLSEAEQKLQDAKKIAVNAESYGYGHGLEAAALLADEIAEKQKKAWDDHIESGDNGPATSFYPVFEKLASDIRALQSEER